MAWAKIVGLDVTPRTWKSRISFSRLPVERRSLLMSSSHTATPAAVSWASVSSDREFMTPLLLALVACAGALPGQAGPGGLGHPLCSYPELLVQGLVGRRLPVVLEAHALAGVADEGAPAERDACLDAHPRTDVCRKHLLPVRILLLSKPFQARHGNDPGGDSLMLQRPAGGQRDLHLAAGPDEDDLWLPARGLRKHVSAAGREVRGGQTLRPVGGAVEHRHVLPGQAEARRGARALQDGPPGHRGLVGVGRPDH